MKPAPLVSIPVVLAMAVTVAGGATETTTPRSAATASRPALATDRIAGLVADDQRLFLSYNPHRRSRWNPSLGGKLDLTGIAWDSPQTATAVTPRHVVMAAHFARRPGDRLIFHDRQGNRHVRSLLKTISLGSKPTWIDIAVGLLDRPLPDVVHTYPLLAPSPDYADRLAGGHVLVTNQRKCLCVREIRFVRETTLQFAYPAAEPGQARQALIKGDSGNPSFLLLDDGPVLVETHSLGGAGAGVFYSAPKVFAAVTNAVRQLDSSHTIRTVRLDPLYSSVASARRADRKVYEMSRTNGTGVRMPGLPAPSGPRRPSSSPRPREEAAPRPQTPPRVRRVPGPLPTRPTSGQQ